MNEYDAIEATPERLARKEQEDINRDHGLFLLGVMAAEDRRKRGGDPLLEAIRQAYEAKAQEADKR